MEHWIENVQVRRSDDGVIVELWYPRDWAVVKGIQVSLVDMRAADDIRIEYDFDRDGWSIKQASKFSWELDDKIQDEDWQEVSFVKAWGREQQ